jgi:glycosyltransferase involved in cell wall biosynthesis
MNPGGSNSGAPARIRLAWVSPVTATKLDAATWLDTTRELRRQGVDVTLITVGPAGKHAYRGIEVLNVPRPSIYLLGQVIFHLHVLRYLLAHRRALDVVLFHQISALWLLPLRLLGRGRPRLVMDTRDMPDFDARDLKVRLRNGLFDVVTGLAARFADGQTAITPRMAELVRIPPRQLWGIWPSGVDAERFAAAAPGRRWPEGDEPVRLVYVGVFLAKRHLLPLCRAVARANAEGLKLSLTLYGDGPLRPELEATAAQSGAVHVAGAIAHEDVPAALSRAHVGVTSLPEISDAKYAASSPVKLFEYMAAGMPVLATRNVCHTDVVGAGRYAFWADDVTEEALLAALRQVWHNRADLSRLGREAAANVHGWTYAGMATKLRQALERGLGQPAKLPAAPLSAESPQAGHGIK